MQAKRDVNPILIMPKISRYGIKNKWIISKRVDLNEGFQDSRVPGFE
jgi:hypothetical protein